MNDARSRTTAPFREAGTHDPSRVVRFTYGGGETVVGRNPVIDGFPGGTEAFLFIDVIADLGATCEGHRGAYRLSMLSDLEVIR